MNKIDCSIYDIYDNHSWHRSEGIIIWALKWSNEFDALRIGVLPLAYV